MVLANYLSINSQLFAFGKGIRDAPAREVSRVKFVSLTLISLSSWPLIYFFLITCIFTK